MAYIDPQASNSLSFAGCPSGHLPSLIQRILSDALEAIDASREGSLALAACSISLAIEQINVSCPTMI